MRPAEHVRANVSGDGLVVLDIDKGEIFSANVVAARIWQRLVVEGQPKEDVIDGIVKEWGGAQDVVTRDLDAFVESLKTHAWVID